MSVRSALTHQSDVLVENVSFASHLSDVGRSAAADLGSIATVTLPPDVAHMSTAGSSDGERGGETNAASQLDGNIASSQIVINFLLTAYPLSLSMLAQFSINMVILIVIGKMLDIEAMGGVSLALGLVNATGFAFSAGLCGALETVLSHTYGMFKGAGATGGGDGGGDNDGAGEAAGSMAEPPASSSPPQTMHIYGIYAQRMTIILIIAAVPLGLVLCFADKLLSSLGESGKVIYYTGVWCRWAVFGIPATMAYQLIQRYYSCQHVTKPLPFALFTGALMNPLLQITFVKMFGFVGSPIAWLVLMVGIVLGLLGYLRYSNLYKLTWGGWDVRCTKDIGSLTAVALPSMGVMLSEWVALEVNALASARAPPFPLAAYSITLQIFGIMWGVASGVMILTCVFVGNAIGDGKPLLARRIAFLAIGIVFCIALFDVIVCFIFENYIPYFFRNEEEVAVVYRKLMYVVLPYHIADTFQSTVMGILRGCELQKLGAIIISIVFCVVGVPLSFLLFFYFDIGVIALWIGPFVGVLVCGVPVYLYVLLRYIKWEELKAHTVSLNRENAAPAHGAPETSENRGRRAEENNRNTALVSDAETPTSEKTAAVRNFIDSAEQYRANATAKVGATRSHTSKLAANGSG